MVSIKIYPDTAKETKLTTPMLITRHRYKAEVHHVTTEDGYILELHRIAGGYKSPAKVGKKVVFLQHGLLDTSATWVLTGPNQGLGFLLADKDYDVWLGNTRGNTYSCNHLKYNPYGSSSDRKKFWAFSWHQIGVYDLPAMIDYVLNETDKTQLQFIGHSQGTTAFYVMCSEKPEYISKVQIMHALAPIAFMTHVRSPPIRFIAPFVFALRTVSSWLGIYNISSTIIQVFSRNFSSLIIGHRSDQLSSTPLAGSAVDQLLHYGQGVSSGRFCQFDFGYIENLIHYKSLSPPDYNLNNVKVPVAIYYAQDDWMSSTQDVKRLLKSLPNVIQSYLIPRKKFSHVDFLWGIDAPTLLYETIFDVMSLMESDEFENIIFMETN